MNGPLRRTAERIVIGAFIWALAEFGIPPHPDGECPAPGCGCKDAAGAVDARAVQIIEAALGHKLPTESDGS